MSQAHLSSGNYIFLIQTLHWLCNGLLTKFIVLKHIYIGHNKIYFHERLNFNLFAVLFLNLLYPFDLVWPNILFYSITYVNTFFDFSTLEYLF